MFLRYRSKCFQPIRLQDLLINHIWNEVRDLTELAGSNTTFTIYYTSNVLLPLAFFLSQYGVHVKLFLHLINCLCNISLLLLFEVTVVGPCKLSFLFNNLVFRYG